MDTLYFTKHSIKRMSKRKITHNDIETCIAFGKVLYKTGLKYYIISKKIIQSYNLPEKLNGLCVLLSKENEVVTAFKNPEVFSYTKCLTKTNIKKFYSINN